MNNEQQFDAVFKYKLDDIQIDQPVNAWDKFSRASKFNKAREGHSFDQAINKSLTSFQVPLSGNEWNSFQKHLQESQWSNEATFDKNIKSKIHKYATNPDARAGKILDSAIEQSVIRTKKLLTSKIIEATFIAIIVLLLFTYTPMVKSPGIPADEKHIPNNSNQDYDRVLNETEKDHNEVSISQNNLDLLTLDNSNRDSKIKSISEKQKSDKTKFNSQSIASGRKISSSLNNSIIKSSRVLPAENGVRDVIINAIEPPASNVGENQKNPLYAENNNTARITQDKNIGEANLAAQLDKNLELVQLDNLSIHPSSLYSHEIHPLHPTLPVFKFKDKKLLSSLWIGFRIGQAFDLIKSPGGYLNGHRLENYQRTKSSIADVNIEFKNDFVNVESGIKYSYKKFSVSDDSYEDAHFINIPLTIKKEFLPHSRLMPFFKIGPDITIVAAASYEPTIENTKNVKHYMGAPALNATNNVNDGIINKGNISTNSFLGIHGAIGFEYKINNYSKFSFDLTQQINPFEKKIGISNYSFSETCISIGYKRLLFENLY